MDRIVVAFENDSSRQKVCEILESAGLAISVSCRSGAEAIRAARKLGGGLVVSGYKLADMTVTDMAYDLTGIATVLAIASPRQLELCVNDNIFKLPTPFSRGDLISSVRMLVQMQEKHYKPIPPRRSEKEMAEISRAKEILMSKTGMTEEEAHRFIQKKSMDTGRKAVETARLIIEMYS